MVPPSHFDEEEARLLLDGSEEEVNQGLSLIDRHLRKGVAGWVRERFPGLSAEDLADVWAMTLAGIFELVRKGRFDCNKPLMPLICTIASARATDFTRRGTARDSVITAVGERLRDTRTGRQWQAFDQAERNEAMELIRAAIATLPRRQGEVFQAFVDHYPETDDRTVLREKVSEATGREVTLVAARRALQEAFEKVRALLRRKGYDLEGRGEE